MCVALGLNVWWCVAFYNLSPFGDQLLRGAALNAVLIAEQAVKGVTV